jgi:hypothetical protein
MNTQRHSGRASKGSQFHLQNLVNDYPEYLNCLILSISPSLRTYSASHPKWVSPLASDDYAEYQDSQFLEAIGFPKLSRKLAGFWPSGGPVWDALATVEGKSGSRGVILLEAKSHLGELASPGYACRATGKSLEQIKNALTLVKRELKVKRNAEWLGEYYQCANRFAHLYFLAIIGQVPTWMVFLYFVGDVEQSGPSTATEWDAPLRKVQQTLGLPERHLLSETIINVYAPVQISKG